MFDFDLSHWSAPLICSFDLYDLAETTHPYLLEVAPCRRGAHLVTAFTEFRILTQQ